LYGGFKRDDLGAQKALGNELKAYSELFKATLKQIQNNEGEFLRIPMSCLVDYMGFRLICQSLLPISGGESLVYGSQDGGCTLENGKEKSSLISMVKELAVKLNLAEHKVMERKTEIMKTICFPADIEIHHGR